MKGNHRSPTALKREIFRQGLVQRQLADELGIDASHFSRIVNGLRPTPEIAERIAERIGVPKERLFR